MQISGTTRVFMLLGDPVAQVQAPRLFNPLFERFGLDAVLVPAQVSREAGPDFIRHVLTAGNIDGLWLTIPHKPLAMPLLERWDRHAEQAQAVNAVRRNADGGLEGALFDGLGFLKALRHLGCEPAGQRVLLVGTGGAGAAIAVALMDQGLQTLALHDLGERAATLARFLATQAGTTPVVAAGNDPAGYDLVINATPLGLRADDPLPFDVARLDAGTCVVDILMKPQATPLLRACAARGITAHPGFEMLVQQVPEYLRFYGYGAVADALQADLSPVRALIGAC